MKKKIFFLLAAFALILTNCSKNNRLNTPGPNVPNSLKGTALINANSVQQTIKGFGGANIIGWVGDLTSSERAKAFSPSSGIGLSIVRVRVSPNSSDWAAEKATIDACKSYGGSAIATAWSAPASMKTNGSMTGGDLKISSYAAYASHLSSFCSAVGGVSAISPDNEPNYTVGYESMNMSASEISNFVAAYGNSCGAPIMAPEPFNMSESFINTYLSNSSAKSKTLAVCGHIYGTSPYSHNFGKSVWMTEHYTNSSVSGNDWSNAMTVAKEIHDCMNVGWSAYVWWYIRRSYGLIDESGNITKLGYVMAQYARYVRPGYSKISCTANPASGIYITAYKSGSKLVVVAINQNSSWDYQPFSLSGISVSGFDRYRTTSSSNLAHDSFSISGSSFGIMLPNSSVTTLVSY